MSKQKKWNEEKDTADKVDLTNGGMAPENKSHGRNTQTKKQVR